MLVFGKYGDGFFVEEDLAATVAELADAKQVVLEGGHDMEVACGKCGQVDVGERGGGVDAAGGVADVVSGGVRFDVADGGGWSDVYVTGARVDDGCVRDGNARRGGATASKRS